MVRMIDITNKDVIKRTAIATGKIFLKKSTIELIKSGRVEKGDVFSVSQISAILAAKITPNLIPLCHPIPITNVDVRFSVNDRFIEVTVKVVAYAKTGVEMEALTAVEIALLNIWDMVKKYEKDEGGQYPFTKISDIKVIMKKKDIY